MHSVDKLGIAKDIAHHALRIKAVTLNTESPFQWASGFFMPIYNDNRMFLGDLSARKRVIDGFLSYIGDTNYDIIAGTATAGIPWASFLADRLNRPLAYIRDKPKDHGKRNRIEGIGAEEDLDGRNVIVIEDLISTGGSSASAVHAVRQAKGIVQNCMAIFSYAFDEAREMFDGIRPFNDTKEKLEGGCHLAPLLGYNTLLEVARQENYINESQAELLAQWRANPFGWGEQRGFPRAVKGDKR